MCSIMGITTISVEKSVVLEYFEKTKSRGPDMSRTIEVGSGYLCFHRLAIMGLTETGMQPFILNQSAVVCNGELYGFRSQRAALQQKGYSFQSDSDCEIILPLYEAYGLDFLSLLDAEFALILYDGKAQKWIAARDPIGIRPLFYGYVGDGSIVFASEAKNLIGLVEHAYPFPPGHYWMDGHFVRYADVTHVDTFHAAPIEAICSEIRHRLVSAVEKRIDADAPIGFLLSGGLDSSLVCAIAARKLPQPIRTFAIGMENDAIDLKYAKQVADYIGSDHTEVIMSSHDVLEALPEVIAALGTYDITTIRASIGMYLVCKYIREHSDIRALLTGEISDELFGYKYTDFAPNAEAFQKEAKKRIDEIYMYDVLRADRCISIHSLEARVPFGDLAFVRYVMAIDPRQKMNTYHMGKYLLRQAFSDGGWLPEEILYRDKAAFSDAVGHSMVDDLKACAESCYTNEQALTLYAGYEYARPFTKESLLYRQLFEQYYPGHADMVRDFWMPNRAWKGCDVADPSARVLSNYGASGV